MHGRITWRNGRFELADDGKVLVRDRDGRIATL
jgi:hypothetical protein